MSHQIPVPPEVGIGPHITVESEVEVELRRLRERVEALEAWVASVQQGVSSIRPAGPEVIPVPEMVRIPAPSGGAYRLIGVEGEAVPLDGFSIGRCPVTQMEWAAVMGTNPSHFRGDPRLPVESISWEEATAFCERLSDAHGLTGSDRYRLPTEAEWEWAASGGVREDRSVTDDTGWSSDNSGGQTHPVGKKKANAFGLHDTLGNVWEWTATEWVSYRVLRGGGWSITPADARVASRFWGAPGGRYRYLGFRLARG